MTARKAEKRPRGVLRSVARRTPAVPDDSEYNDAPTQAELDAQFERWRRSQDTPERRAGDIRAAAARDARVRQREAARPDVEARAEAEAARAARAYSPLPDELGPIVPMTAALADIPASVIDAGLAATGDRSAATRRDARTRRWRRGINEAARDSADPAAGLDEWAAAIPGAIRSGAQSVTQERAARGLRTGPLDYVAPVARSLWMGWPEAGRDARARVAYSDVIADAASASGDRWGAAVERDAGDEAAGDDFMITAPGALEPLALATGQSLLNLPVSAGRATGRGALRMARLPVPRALEAPVRDVAGPLTQGGRRFVGDVATLGVAPAARRAGRVVAQQIERLPAPARVPATVAGAATAGAGLGVASNALAQEDGGQEYDEYDENGNLTPSSEQNGEFDEYDEQGNLIAPAPASPEQDNMSLGDRAARGLATFAPLALLPGSARARAARVVAPAVASETADAAAQGTGGEVPARIAGATAGALALEGALALRGRNPARAPIDPEILALERDYGPLTAGERARDPAAMQRESTLRRGGPAQAQARMRGFEDDRAPVVADNLMRRMATRGRDPITPDAGSAGTMLADELRSQLDAMEVEQGKRYARATDIAGSAPVAPTDELISNVNRVVDEDFLEVGPAVRVIERLQGEIAGGRATYLTVERARQALNRQLGAAMRAGDDAQTYAIRRIIDEVDAFVLPRLPAQAAQAIQEARGFTQEMMQWYGQQARPTLATGHVGRRDPGGGVVQRIIETDMTGDQVIDVIFGASARPPRSALSAVQRIKDRATQQIQSAGYQAGTAAPGRQARSPGRPSLRGGRATAGGRRFDPTPAQQQRFGVELPKDDLQALREAFVYRLRRPIEARRQGDALGSGVMASNLRQALHGPGRELTEIIFNPSERAEMNRALQYLERITPPTGSYMPSAPGIAQDAAEKSMAALFARMIGSIPGGSGVEQAIQDGIVNARAVRDARTATTPYQQTASARPPTEAQPRLAGAAAAGLAAGSEAGEQTGAPDWVAPVAGGAALIGARRAIPRALPARPGSLRALPAIIGGAGLGYVAESALTPGDAEANPGGVAGRGAGLLGGAIGAALGARKGRLLGAIEEGVPAADRVARRVGAEDVVPSERENSLQSGTIRRTQEGHSANIQPGASPTNRRQRGDTNSLDVERLRRLADGESPKAIADADGVDVQSIYKSIARARAYMDDANIPIPPSARVRRRPFDLGELVNEVILRDENGTLISYDVIAANLYGEEAPARLARSIEVTLSHIRKRAVAAVERGDDSVAALAQEWNVTPDRVRALAELKKHEPRGYRHGVTARRLVASGVTEPSAIVAGLRDAAERNGYAVPPHHQLKVVASQARRLAGLTDGVRAHPERNLRAMEEIYALRGAARARDVRPGVPLGDKALAAIARRHSMTNAALQGVLNRHWERFVASKQSGALAIGATGAGGAYLFGADEADASSGNQRTDFDWGPVIGGAGAAAALYGARRLMGKRSPRGEATSAIPGAAPRNARGELRDMRANFEAGRRADAPIPRTLAERDAVAPPPPRAQPGGSIDKALQSGGFDAVARVMSRAPEVRGNKLRQLANSVGVDPVFVAGKLDRQATMAAILRVARGNGRTLTPRAGAVAARLREMGLWAIPAAIGVGAIISDDAPQPNT